jgi:16S rRNA U516 pseudouridylate synthase RsuA-like enzyme
MLLLVGHPVVKLRRLAIGGVELGDLPVGRFRHLTSGEMKRLEALVRKGRKGP